MGRVPVDSIGRYGDAANTARTSTKPTLVNPLQGLTVMQVAMGFGHSLLLARWGDMLSDFHI